MDIDDKIVQLQRDAARPYPYHFEIQMRPPLRTLGGK
jgi:hypothetical protein